jgi:hypothetical protein
LLCEWSRQMSAITTHCRNPEIWNDGLIRSFLLRPFYHATLIVSSVELSLHPLISFSTKKELHFFDRVESYRQGVTSYLEKFHFFNPSTLSSSHRSLYETSQLQMPIFTEATPFYLASRDACQRISQTIPSVKLIILLRDPIDRAYSEYQMKKR